ncbi:N-anthranilate isomerase [Thelephora ganbajun]|uniref:N-anthranilate isomerase n=1 Tax=Thelephora ganbajun TaxID=370292 RepID=A0ACB6ZNF2_THEGA|nr:N-anthranilate isomerase [Thelephora ganbajun]
MVPPGHRPRTPHHPGRDLPAARPRITIKQSTPTVTTTENGKNKKPLLPELTAPIEVLMIDNFDSFAYNLYQYISLLGVSVTVIRNDAITPEDFPKLNIKYLVISPGPGHPSTDGGVSQDAIKYFMGRVPVLGVCMGLECLVDVFGGEIEYAGEIMHGKVSRVRHDGRGCFKDIPQGIKSIRYHSLSANVNNFPRDLAITATTEESGVIMGVRHRKYTLESVQYHPESILSESGDKLFANFLALRGGTWDENPSFRVQDPNLPPFEVEIIKGIAPTKEQQRKVPSILDKIYSQRLKDVDMAKSTPGTSPHDLSTLLKLNLAPPQIDFVKRMKVRSPALMAEIKRASPSKGPISMSANAAQQALDYALSGVSAISVLTEPTWFKGSLLDMYLARQAVDSLTNRPAILRKDFILDEYQISEARLHGADTVLLIVSMLPLGRLQVLYDFSLSLGMEPLVEVNNGKEMEIALSIGAKVIGVNNRNLHSFDVDMGTTTRLVDMVRGRDVTLCALSGITGPEDVRMYTAQGVRGVLIGEALMRAGNTRKFIRELLDIPEALLSSSVPADHRPSPLVKVCGIRTEQEAVDARDAGVDLLGLMFVQKSRRRVGYEEAKRISSRIRSERLASPSLARSGSHPEQSPSSTAIVDVDPATNNEPWFTTQSRRLSKAISASGAGPLLVGVFQDQPLEFILQTVAETQLDIVQLHGNEPVEWSKHIPVPVIKVFHIKAASPISSSVAGVDPGLLRGLRRPGLNEFVLLDSVHDGPESGGLSGGSGKIVDWDLAKAVVELGEIDSGLDGDATSATSLGTVGGRMPIILAGGLTPGNVAEAISRVKPWAVDVSGGVENEDGTGKDLEKVRAFAQAVRCS